MKLTKLFAATVAVLTLTSCGAAYKSGVSSNCIAEDLYYKALDNQELTIEVTYINPTGVSSRPSTDGYTLNIKDGHVNASLPFFGRSYSSVVFGIDQPGIVFEDYPIEIIENAQKASRGEVKWIFSARSGGDKVDVTVTFRDDGSATIHCNPLNRTPITYTGILRPSDCN